MGEEILGNSNTRLADETMAIYTCNISIMMYIKYDKMCINKSISVALLRAEIGLVQM
jgi:uncharacterized ion transporter superfamily protein YfcC